MGATLRTSQSKWETGGLGEVEVRWCLRFFKPREGCWILLAWKASQLKKRIGRKEQANNLGKTIAGRDQQGRGLRPKQVYHIQGRARRQISEKSSQP